MLNLSNLKIIVISMKTDINRRKNISNQLNILGLKFDFFDAIIPRDNPEYKKYYNSLKARSIYNRDLTLGELGCALSHQFVYKMLLEDVCCNYLILEDDAILNNNIVDLLNNIDFIGGEWDVILLGYSKVSPSYYKKLNLIHPIGKSIYKFNKFSLGEVFKNSTCGTVAYLINKSGAEKLINYNKEIYNLADDWFYFDRYKLIKILHCRPFLVFEDYINFESSIEKERSLVSKKVINSFFRDFLLYFRGFIYFFILRFFK